MSSLDAYPAGEGRPPTPTFEEPDYVRYSIADVGVDSRSQEILGTATKEETVNAALQDLVRRAAAEDFLAVGRGGGLRGVADAAVTGEAWR